MARQTTEKEAQEFIAFTRAYTDKLISEGPEACKAFLDKVVPPTFHVTIVLATALVRNMVAVKNTKII